MSLSLTLQRRPQRPHLDYKKTRTEKSYGVNTRCLIEVEKKTLPGVTKSPSVEQNYTKITYKRCHLVTYVTAKFPVGPQISLF